jgi:predicted MFS family arabinose efflux permease
MDGRAADRDLRLTLGVLLVVYIFNFLDRQIVTILAEPIARDLDLSDTQIGVLTGLAFALFYTAMGVPIARIADRPTTNRVTVIAVSLAIWSAMTALCGLAQNFTQLLLARFGVGVGEAGGTPPSHSLITDKAPPEKRASAFGIYQMGPPIGGLIGMVLGGVLADTVGWRCAFVLVGLPGLLLALVVRWLVRDPRVTGDSAPSAATGLSTRAALGAIWQSPTMRRMLAVSCFAPFALYGMLIWTTIFFQRSHGLTAGETGVWFGLVNGIGAILGVWGGGKLGDRTMKRGAQHLLTIPAWGLILTCPFTVAALLVADWQLALALLFPAVVMSWLYVAPFYSAVQGIVPPATRAVASASILFVQNLVGLGLGPVALGFVSDRLKPEYGDDSVRYVLIVASLAAVAAGLILLSARRLLAGELNPNR